MRSEERALRDRLLRGERLEIVAAGQSMAGLIDWGDGIVIAPCTGADVKTGDIVFVRVRRRYCVHLVESVGETGVLIGDNVGHVNGWTPHDRVYGIVVEVVRGGFAAGHPAHADTAGQ